MRASVPHALGMGYRVQSQGTEVRKISKPEAPSGRQPGCRAILRSRDLCPSKKGEVIGHGLGPQGYQKGRTRQPHNPACRLLAQDPLNTSQRFQPKFEVGSPKLSSAEPFLQALLMLASTPHPPGPCNPSLCSPLLQEGEQEGGGEGPDT